MPITFKLVKDKGYYIAHWEGIVSDKEMLDGYMSFLNGPEWTPGVNELCDVTRLTIPVLSSSGLTQLALRIEKVLKEQNVTDFKTAIVSKDEFLDDIARLYSSLLKESRVTIIIFRNFEEAEAWLLGPKKDSAG